MAFPANPSLNAFHTEGGVRYQWGGRAWRVVASAPPVASAVAISAISGLSAANVQAALAEINTDVAALAAIGGQYVGAAATFATLPDERPNATPLQSGDTSILTADDGANDAGWYAYNGTIWEFLFGLPDIAAATTTAAGIVELATTAETQTGSDTTRAVTPAALAAAVASHETLTTLTASGSRLTYTDEAGTPAALDTRIPTGAALPANGNNERGFVLVGHASLPDGFYCHNGTAWFQI